MFVEVFKLSRLKQNISEFLLVKMMQTSNFTFITLNLFLNVLQPGPAPLCILCAKEMSNTIWMTLFKLLERS